MKVFLVQNGDGIVMGIFKKKKQAESCAKNIGKKRWDEHWSINKIILGGIDPTMLAGCESYKMRRKK